MTLKYISDKGELTWQYNGAIVAQFDMRSRYDRLIAKNRNGKNNKQIKALEKEIKESAEWCRHLDKKRSAT